MAQGLTTPELISSKPRISSPKRRQFDYSQQLFTKILIKCKNFSQKRRQKGNLIQLKFVKIRHKKKRREINLTIEESVA